MHAPWLDGRCAADLGFPFPNPYIPFLPYIFVTMLLNLILTILQVDICQGALLTRQNRLDGRDVQPRAQEKYLPLPVVPGPYKEGYQSAAVITTSVPGGIAQIPLPVSTATPDTTGRLITALETEGRSSVIPFPTGKIPPPSSLLVPFGPPTKLSSPPSTTKMAQAAASSDIFGAPIATNAPAAIFQVRNDHPAPRLGITDTGPHQTNKFYANFFLGNQNAPTYVHPYSVAWAKGQGASASWGLSISHVEANQRVYGPTSSTGAVKYYLNPVGIQSICLSAAELGPSTALTLDSMAAQSVNVNLLDRAGGRVVVTFPLVQGMGFVTGLYAGSTPVINSGVFFRTVTKSTTGPKPGMTKYTLYLEDGKVWHLYAFSSRGDSLELQVVSNGFARATKPFSGIIQVAKDPGNAEALLDAASGAYPAGVTLSGSVSGSRGTYTFTYVKRGIQNNRLLMYALPHHIECFDANTNMAKTNVQLQTTTKGMATAVVADLWTMVEPNMPVTMDFAPWDPVRGPQRNLRASYISTISPVALKEISQNMDQQSNQNSMYFSGKVRSSWNTMRVIIPLTKPGARQVCSRLLCHS